MQLAVPASSTVKTISAAASSNAFLIKSHYSVMFAADRNCAVCYCLLHMLTLQTITGCNHLLFETDIDSYLFFFRLHHRIYNAEH